MSCSNCFDQIRVPFERPDGTTRYVPCWECERGQSLMGIGQHFHGAALDPASQRDRGLMAWPGTPPGWYLYGDVGRGKTYLAAAICRAKAAVGRRVRFISSKRLLDTIKLTFDDASREHGRYALAQLAEADIVVLDDLGVELATEWAETELTGWIDGFYERDTALVVTSNLDLGELAARLGERIASRIVGMTQAIELTGPDRRLRGPMAPRVQRAPEPIVEPSPAEHAATAARCRPLVQEAVAALMRRGPATTRRPARRIVVPAPEHGNGNGNGLKPEYRAEIEAALREGREATLAERWRPFVDQVRTEMQATA